MSTGTKKTITLSGPVGRYSPASAPIIQDGGFGRAPASIQTRTRIAGATSAKRPEKVRREAAYTVGAVPNPYDATQTVAVTINRRVDLLEEELSRPTGGIGVAEYHAGRKLQAMFERAAGVSASSWSGGDRVDAAASHELAIGYGIETAEKIVAMEREVYQAVGAYGGRLLRDILGDNKSYATVAAERGRPGDRGRRFVAEQFREYLRELATKWAAKGKSR